MPLVCMVLQSAAGPSSLAGTLIPMVLMFGLAWLLLIRPVQKQRKEQQAMRNALKAGDEVLTTGGLYGTITRLRDHRLGLRVADGVQVEISRAAVLEVVQRKENE